MEPAKGVIIGEKYVLERVLGHGGMGSVWLAHHWKLGAPVAIKLLRTENTRIELARARFEREAMMMAKLRSRHVIGVNDYGVQDNHAYIVMEMLVGEDLNERIQREGHLGPEEVHFIIEQAARGLVVAHEAGIIHRDLKPANIYIAEQDREEVVKLLDFGIAKAMEGPLMGGRLTGSKGESETKTGVLLGSPHYMSPEHIQGDWDIVDHRSDLWALGVIAYRALTGQLPFPGDTLPKVMIGICKDDPVSARTHVPSLPAALDDFFAQALAKAREDRFDSAPQLAHALAYTLGLGPASSKVIPPRPMASSSPSLPAMDGSTGERAVPTESDLKVTLERAPRDGVTVALDEMPTLERPDKPVVGPPPRSASPPLAPPQSLHAPTPAVSEMSTGSFVTEPTFSGAPPRTPTMTIVAVAGALLLLGVTGGALTFLTRGEPATASARPFVRDLRWPADLPPASDDDAEDADDAGADDATEPEKAGADPAQRADTGPPKNAPPPATPRSPWPRSGTKKQKKTSESKFKPGY